MKLGWVVGITAGVMTIIILILIRVHAFSGWTFFGMVWYILLFVGGYMFIMYGKQSEQRRLDEEAKLKQKFDYCWAKTNTILRRLPGGQGLEWAAGFGRKSEYRTYYDGVQSHAFRSMLGFLSNTQQVALVIYDIDRDDIVRFITNPDVDFLDNHFRNFKPFSRGGSGGGYDGFEYDRGANPYYPVYSRRYGNRAPVSINVGGEPNAPPRDARVGPDDDMVDSAVKRVKE